MAIRNDFAPGEVLAAADLNDTFGSKLDLAGGKILQIVRETDSTERSTTSTSFVDVTGMSVTITPQKNDSAIILVGICLMRNPAGSTNSATIQLTDNSNNAISGAESVVITALDSGGVQTFVNVWGYSTPATTSATTYKMRFRVNSGTSFIRNNTNTGQMYAIEVSA
jgi:hypothetical protein